MSQLYPLFLKLEGLLCGVVGGGMVAQRKARALLDCGARVRMIAPEATEELRALESEGKIEWVRRQYQEGDLAGLRLVVAATDEAEVNSAVRSEASERDVLCNVVDQRDLCDFYVPAVIQRGDLKIAISTNGKSPELAKALRDLLEQRIGEDVGRVVEEAGKLREAIRHLMPDSAAGRMHLLRNLVRANELIEALEQGDRKKTEAIVESWKSFLSD